MAEANYNPKIIIEYNVRDTVDVEIDLHDTLSAMNELPLTLKWNFVAGILKHLETTSDKDNDILTDQQKGIIKSFLVKKLEEFNNE